MIDQIAGWLGASRGSVESAAKGGIPGLLATMLSATQNNASAADAFATALKGQSPDMLSGLGDMLSRDPAGLGAQGSDLLSGIIGGGRMGTFASTLSRFAGFPEGAGGPFLGLLTNFVMGKLGGIARERGLDASGVLGLLSSDKAAIAQAMPRELANSLRSAGMLDAVGAELDALDAPVRATPPRAQVEPVATLSQPVHTPRMPQAAAIPAGRPWWHWLVGLLILGLILWLLSNLFGGDRTEEVAEGATTSALMVGDVDVGSRMRTAMSDLTTSLAGITSTETATSAMATLTRVQGDLTSLAPSISQLGAEGKSALSALIGGQLPALEETVTKLMGNSDYAGIIGPALTAIIDQIKAFVA
ncbi:hypothetical protein SAMN06265221_1065 [Paracoccus laeviglucosivorans]|uniref:DUF937 domain-containing protein n=2 Tax=Paracoccus laeviglucosivorans TaxID=1197861 RepID=A0A521D4K8_9RHOB|nr:hypothetical protein SAMN06265221_1065 [Paracoccus laeviglucosivorans]